MVNSIRKLYVAYNNAFRMLFRLPRDCSASGMFAVCHELPCPCQETCIWFLQESELLSKLYCSGHLWIRHLVEIFD